MRYIITLLLSALLLSAFAQTEKNQTCTLYVDKTALTGSTIKAIQLEHLGTLEVEDSRLAQRFKVKDFQWVISYRGTIVKGTVTQLYKIKDIMPNLKPKDALFIENIKLDGYTGICQGQWAFTLW